MSKSFNLALAQMLVMPGDVGGNLARAEERIATAAKRGADIVLLPEALDCGWAHPSASESAGTIPEGDSCRRLCATAKQHGVFVCGGLTERGERTHGRPSPAISSLEPELSAPLTPSLSPPRRRGEGARRAGEGSSGVRFMGGDAEVRTELFNAAVLIDPRGEVILHHRKINELEFARELYSVGDRLGVAETPWGRAGLMICADAFAPGQIISRSLAMMGARFILSPCAWAVPADHDNVREPYGQLWLDNYCPVARDFGVWIAGCSNVGPITSGEWAGRKCIGNSLVCAPPNLIAARGNYGETADEIVMVRVELP